MFGSERGGLDNDGVLERVGQCEPVAHGRHFSNLSSRPCFIRLRCMAVTRSASERGSSQVLSSPGQRLGGGVNQGTLTVQEKFGPWMLAVIQPSVPTVPSMVAARP